MNSFHKKITVVLLVISLFAFLSLGLGSWDGLAGRSPLTAILSESMRQNILSELTRILALIQELQRQLNELIQKENSSTAATTTDLIVNEAIPIPPPKLIANDLKFKIDFPIIQDKNYLDFVLFDFIIESKENMAITRLRFKQTGTLSDALIDNFRLVDASSGSEVLLAKFGNPVDGFIELVMALDANKINKGLIVPGRRYKVLSTITVSYGVLKPTVSLSIEKLSDISIFDFNNLDRVVDIPASIFPIGGPTYTISI